MAYQGNNAYRPGLRRIIRDAEVGRFKTFVVAASDRVMTDVDQMLEFTKNLGQKGVALVANLEGQETHDRVRTDYFITNALRLSRFAVIQQIPVPVDEAVSPPYSGHPFYSIRAPIFGG